MKRIYLVFFAGLLLLPVGVLLAAEHALTPSLILNQVKVLKASERDGDELYFDISVYRPGHTTHYLRVPEKPIHWTSRVIERVKSVPLWSQPLKSGQAITLIVSLIDSDMSVLNPDDLIGSMRVDIKNKNGALQISWSMPNRVDGPITIANQNGDVQKFELRDKHGQYDVYLSLKK